MAFRTWALAAAAVVVIAAAASAATWWMASREVASGITTLNATGQRGRALLVYHPGLSGFPEKITGSFAEGLVRAGWRVDMTTASAQAPGDVRDYGLVVLGSPVYSDAAARPLSAYIDRVGDFHAKGVVLVFTAASDANPAMDKAAAQVSALHGRVLGRYGYTSPQPNPSDKAYSGTNAERAAAMARDAALSLATAPH